MFAFLYCYCYKNEVFGITDSGDIYRIWLEGNQPLIQKLIGDENEWRGCIRILKALVEAYD